MCARRCCHQSRSRPHSYHDVCNAKITLIVLNGCRKWMECSLNTYTRRWWCIGMASILKALIIICFSYIQCCSFDERKLVHHKHPRRRVLCLSCPGLAPNRTLLVHEMNASRFLREKNDANTNSTQADNNELVCGAVYEVEIRGSDWCYEYLRPTS